MEGPTGLELERSPVDAMLAYIGLSRDELRSFKYRHAHAYADRYYGLDWFTNDAPGAVLHDRNTPMYCGGFALVLCVLMLRRNKMRKDTIRWFGVSLLATSAMMLWVRDAYYANAPPVRDRVAFHAPQLRAALANATAGAGAGAGAGEGGEEVEGGEEGGVAEEEGRED